MRKGSFFLTGLDSAARRASYTLAIKSRRFGK